VDADSNSQPRVRPDVRQPATQSRRRVEQPKPGPNGALGIVLVGLRPSEVDQKPVPEELGDMAVEMPDNLGAGLLVGADDLAELLGVQSLGERRKGDQVAEHHGELAALGTRRLESGRRSIGPTSLKGLCLGCARR
jgi:hypothetical protein